MQRSIKQDIMNGEDQGAIGSRKEKCVKIKLKYWGSVSKLSEWLCEPLEVVRAGIESHPIL